MTRLSRVRFINADRTRLPVRRRGRPRGIPNALQDHPIAVTGDLKEAKRVASALLGPATVVPQRGTNREFQCTLHGVQFLDVTMAYLDFRVATDVFVPESADCYTVHMTTTGEADVRVAGVDHQLSAFFALVVSPGTEYRLRLGQECPQMIVRIERAAMERQLSRLLGRSLDAPLVFSPVADLTTDRASRWTGALSILSVEVMSPKSLIQRGVGMTSLEDLIVSTLLYVQPSNYSSRLSSESPTSGRVAVRRAVEYIEQHLSEPITLDDLAAYSRTSIRSIQAGFRADLDTTPVAYIRDRRLDKVRSLLMAAVPGDGVDVTNAAQQCGFNHLGNFGAAYRRRFGEMPSETLRR